MTSTEDQQVSETVSEALRIVINQIELILEYFVMGDHLFLDDFRVAITKTKLEEKRNVCFYWILYRQFKTNINLLKLLLGRRRFLYELVYTDPIETNSVDE